MRLINSHPTNYTLSSHTLSTPPLLAHPIITHPYQCRKKILETHHLIPLTPLPLSPPLTPPSHPLVPPPSHPPFTPPPSLTPSYLPSHPTSNPPLVSQVGGSAQSGDKVSPEVHDVWKQAMNHFKSTTKKGLYTLNGIRQQVTPLSC